MGDNGGTRQVITTFLARDIERLLVRLIGWLAAPPRHPWLRSLGTGVLNIRRWHLAAAAAVTAHLASTARQRYLEARDEGVQHRRRLQAQMLAARSYFEWSIKATKLDALDGTSQQQRWAQETRLYDRRLLEEKAAHLRRVRTGGGVADQMFAVRADLIRNLGNITNSALHEHFPVIPEPIREYIEEVKNQLEDITNSPELPLEEKSAFLRETRHAFGRTALVLSGGGPLATYHLGVVRALLEHRLLPRVLAGSNTGSVVCALACTRTDDELMELLEGMGALDLAFFATPTTPQALHTWLSRGDEGEASRRRLRHLLGDLTFMEAFQRTGRILNIALSPADTSEPPRLFNYLTAPHVLVWSAAAPCCPGPLAGSPQELLARSERGELTRLTADVSGKDRLWRDGSLDEEMPTRGLSEMFGANYFIVSQTNPRVVPLLNARRRWGTAGQLAEAELKHRCRQLVEVLPGWAPTRTLRALSQPWEGDVTMVLPDSLAQLRGALLTPSRAQLAAAARMGELCAWSKLSAIQCNCGIEVTLDACIQQVSTWERQERRNRLGANMPLKSRVPSWMHLSGAAAAGEPGAGCGGSLGTMRGSASCVSLAHSDGFDNDGVYDDDDHLPLPEERAPLEKIFHAPAMLDCTDASVAWSFSGPSRASQLQHLKASTDALDHIAF
ncbi:hypothetical protein N2152v2_005514 [Parachlorella kessleri]